MANPANLNLNLKVNADALKQVAAQINSTFAPLSKPMLLPTGAFGGQRPALASAVGLLNAQAAARMQSIVHARVAATPAMVERRVAQENELKEAKINLHESLKAQRKIEGEVAEPAITTDERRVAGIRAVNAGIEAQQQQLAKLNAALDPTKLQERVRLSGELKIAQMALNEAEKKEIELQGEVVDKAVTYDERRVAALRKVNLELERQEQQMVDLDARLDPTTMKQRVANTLKIEEYQRELSFDENKERAKQLGIGRGFLDLFNIPDLSKHFARIGGMMAGLGEMIGGTAGSLLGKAGAALAIPGVGQIAGLASVALPMLTKGIKELAAAPFAAVNAGLKGLLGPLGPIGSALSISTGLLDGFAGALHKIPIVGSVLALAPEMLSTAMKQLGEFLQTAVSLVAKARPGEVKRLQFALDDTAAVVGHRLTPVVELMREVVRGMGDVLQTVLPSTQEFRNALSPLRGAFGDLKLAIAPMASFLKYNLVIGLRVATFSLQQFIMVLRSLPLVNLAIGVGQLLDALGGGLESSVGAAARQVQITNPEDYSRAVYAAAAGSGQDPTSRTAENTSNMLRVLEQILDRISGSRIGDTVGQNATGSGADIAADAARRSWLGLGGT